MNNIVLVVSIGIGALIFGALVSFFISRKKTGNRSLEIENLSDIISRLSVEALDKNSQRFLMMAKEVLTAQKSEMRTDLEGKKETINTLITEIRKDLKKNEERLAISDEQRIKSFSALEQELGEYKKITGELKMSADKLKSLLSNNQLRGAFGEQIAENLLKMAGFVIGQDYFKNQSQETQSTRPDFTILLPDKTKINIDVKFPYSSLVKSIESESEQEKKRYFLEFRQDVKNKIKQVCTREYINPEEKTVDFVVLFIPNEMIFSYIYDQMNEVWEEAMRKKVVLAGPFSFTAILRMIKQAYTNFRYQENLHEIIGLIARFEEEYKNFSKSIDILGERISSASKQFDTVSTTRSRQLTRVVDKIKDRNPIEAEKTDQIENIAVSDGD